MDQIKLLKGEKRYFMQREVIVERVWEIFHLVKVKEQGSGKSYYVDICALTIEPDLINSISLRLLSKKIND